MVIGLLVRDKRYTDESGRHDERVDFDLHLHTADGFCLRVAGRERKDNYAQR